MERRPGSVRHWGAPLAADPGVRRDITKLMTGASKAQTLAAARTTHRAPRGLPAEQDVR
jgi:hypothetical protein